MANKSAMKPIRTPIAFVPVIFSENPFMHILMAVSLSLKHFKG
jgi:hypothetical protein